LTGAELLLELNSGLLLLSGTGADGQLQSSVAGDDSSRLTWSNRSKQRSGSRQRYRHK
jgi:hypothetical protein